MLLPFTIIRVCKGSNNLGCIKTNVVDIPGLMGHSVIDKCHYQTKGTDSRRKELVLMAAVGKTEVLVFTGRKWLLFILLSFFYRK